MTIKTQILAIFSIFFIACATKKEDKITYFGGKIINPRSNYILVSTLSGVLLDSIKLKSNHTFLGKLKINDKGIYRFNHGNEFQYIYLEPKDSLLIRLNTWDFDESLVFSGVNANRNNALIDLFLQNERDRRNNYKLFNFNPQKFKSNIDLLIEKKKKFIQEYKERNMDESDYFIEILEVASLYPVYKNFENYYIYKLNNSPTKKINRDFLQYRDSILLNKDKFLNFSPYSNLLINTIYTNAYLKGYKKNTDDFNTSLLEDIDLLINDKKFKNNFLKNIVVSQFYNSKNVHKIDKTLKTFYSKCTNKEYIQDLKNLSEDFRALKKNDTLYTFNLNSFDGNIVNSDSLLFKKSVLYFRNRNRASDNWVASRFNYFIKKYPNINFYLININKNNPKQINRMAAKNQFYISGKSSVNEFFNSNYSRVVLLDENKIVQNDFIGLSSENINKEIERLQNK